jgi:hypothetical protein
VAPSCIHIYYLELNNCPLGTLDPIRICNLFITWLVAVGYCLEVMSLRTATDDNSTKLAINHYGSNTASSNLIRCRYAEPSPSQ